MRARQVVARVGGWRSIDDEVQPLAARRVAAPGLPGGEEVVAEAEAGFQDHEAVAPGPAPGQAVAAQEDVPRLRRAPTRGW